MYLRLRLFAAQKMGINYRNVQFFIGENSISARGEGKSEHWASLEDLLAEFDAYVKKEEKWSQS